MGKTRIGFDEDRELNAPVDKLYAVLKPRRETIVGLTTDSPELRTGLIGKRELAPGVMLAETLTRVREGT